MIIYNPVQPLTPLDKARDFYWTNRTICDSLMFLGVIALTIGLLVAMA